MSSQAPEAAPHSDRRSELGGAQGAPPSVSTVRGSCKRAISVHRLSFFWSSFPARSLRPEFSHVPRRVPLGPATCKSGGRLELFGAEGEGSVREGVTTFPHVHSASRTWAPCFLLPACLVIAIAPGLPQQSPSPGQAKAAQCSTSQAA